ncbi:MAG TPA: hypothetical protein VG898_08215 [Solirubrobacterales bacterium]|nr:hypothetical protein [Solirubrobacterales bacterium]
MGEGQTKLGRAFVLCVAGGVLQLPIVLLLISGQDAPWADAALALSAGVAASAVWWAFFSRYAESQGRQFLERQLTEQRKVLNLELKSNRDLLVEEMEEGAKRWRDSGLPRDIYAATEGFDLRFNHDLTDDFERSSRYYFCGRSGIYVPARILLRDSRAPRRLEDVRLKVIDPLGVVAMKQAIRDRRGRENNHSKSDDELRAEIVDHLLMTIVGLWQARDRVRGTIRVWHESTSVVKRIELFDGAVYDANIDGLGNTAFPSTGCWLSGTPGYTRISSEFDRRDQASASFEISTMTKRQELDEHLERLGCDPKRFEELWDRYLSKYLQRMKRGLPRARALETVEGTRALEEDGNG